MQLTTIALATILISSLATGSKDISPSLKARMAAFQTPDVQPEGSSKKQGQPKPGVRGQPLKRSAPTTHVTAPSASTVKTFPSSIKKVTDTSPLPKPTSSSTGLPAPTPAKPPAPRATTGSLKPGSGEKPHVSKIAGLRKHWEPASTSESTSAPKPPVKTPSSSSSTETMGGHVKPTPGSGKKSTTTSRTGPIQPPTVSPAPKFTKPAASPQFVTESLGSAPILLPSSGAPLGPPQFYREKGLGVAGLAKKFEPTPLPSQPSSKSLAAPKMSRVTEDTDLMNFKEKIEKGAYSEAMEIVVSLSGEKSCEPYGKYLADLTVDKIIEMVNGFEEAFLTESLPEGEHEYILKSPYSKPTLGLFLMHANDIKLTLLLPCFGPRNQLGALMSSIKYGAGSSLGNFIKVFREISIIDKNELSFALEAAAECIFGYYEPEFFNELVIKLRDQKILDKDLVNVALNAAFVEACRQENFSALNYYDLKDVDFPSWVYAKAMRLSYDKTRDRNDIFTWLVGCADGDDLHIFLRENNGENRYVGEKLKMIEDLYLMRRYEPKKPRTKSSSSSYSYLFDKQQE